MMMTNVLNISHSKNNSARHNKCAYVFMHSGRYSCHHLTRPEFSPHKFDHVYGQKDKHDEANKTLFATLGTRLLKWVPFTLVYLHSDGFYFTIIAVKVHGDRE